MGTFEEQEKRDRKYSRSLSVEERLRQAYYLTCICYKIDPKNPPRMDKTKFSVRKIKQ